MTKKANIEIQIPKGDQFLSIARLAASGIASKMNFSLDEIENIKTAVSEACVCGENNNEETDISINFEMDNNTLKIQVLDKYEPANNSESDIEMSFIKSLMDELEVVTNEEIGRTIKMTKYNYT